MSFWGSLERCHIRGAFFIFLVAFPAFLIYQNGLSGGFHLDDIPNLKSLSGVNEEGLGAYIRSAPVGGLGRPISYLSFYLQRADYPAKPKSFLVVNLAIHLLNSILLYFLVVLLARERKVANPAFFATAVAMLWSLLPVHVSTVLYVVQRMTLLSTFFVLLGVVGYVYERVSVRSLSVKTYLSLSFFCGVAYLGVFAKENAALAGLFFACIELFFLRSVRPSPNFLWRFVVFLLPAIALFIYLISIANVGGQYGGREYTLWERMLTESMILWDYVKIILFPGFGDFGFFHDDFPVSRGWGWSEVLSVSSWGVVILWAIGLVGRWGKPIAFGFLSFLSLHLLESTIVPLELYFEHRNYLPSVGLVVGVAFFLYRFWVSLKNRLYVFLFYGSVAIYFLWIALVALVEIRAWGDPVRFSVEAFYRHPTSPRAMEEIGQALVDKGDFGSAYAIYKEWRESRPELYTPGVDLAILLLSCHDSSIPFSWTDEMRVRFMKAKSDRPVYVLQEIFELVSSERCKSVSLDEYVELLDALLSNPGYRSDAKMAAHLRRLKAYAFMALGEREKALDAVVSGVDIDKVGFDYLLLIAVMAYEAHDGRALGDVYRHIRSRRPPRFLLSEGQKRLLDRLDAVVP